MERRSERTPAAASRTIVDAKMSLSLWLRAGRAQRGLSLEQVAKITKIQVRILERLEAGKLDGLPAEVFVRGFVRSFARCVGLDEAEALQRYTLAAGQPVAPTAAARALVESMSELAPATATRSPRVLRRDPELGPESELAAGSLPDLPQTRPDTVVETFLPETGTLMLDAVETVPEVGVEIALELEIEAPGVAAPVIDAAPIVVEAAPVVAVEVADGKKKRARRGGKGRGKQKDIATGTPAEALPVVAAQAQDEIVPVLLPPIDVPLEAAPVVGEILAEGSTATTIEISATTEVLESVVEPTETWAPKMPVIVTPSVPWRRPFGASSAGSSAVVPSLVIDDSDPDSAERELEDRAAASVPARRSFLPPILLDREDRSARQGGLTLAVIILLIAATLTLSYLMRRPSSTGDGVTQAETAHDILAST